MISEQVCDWFTSVAMQESKRVVEGGGPSPDVLGQLDCEKKEGTAANILGSAEYTNVPILQRTQNH